MHNSPMGPHPTTKTFSPPCNRARLTDHSAQAIGSTRAPSSSDMFSGSLDNENFFPPFIIEGESCQIEYATHLWHIVSGQEFVERKKP